MKKNLIFLSLMFCFLVFNSCCSLFGSYDLGNNFTLLDGDRLEDRIIIYCSPNRKTNCCSGGSYVIPRSEKHFNSKGEYAEYVEEAKHNDKWIIAKTLHIKSQNKSYWIIEKDSKLEEQYQDWFMSDNNYEDFNKLIQSHVYGPFDYGTFIEKKEELGVKIKF